MSQRKPAAPATMKVERQPKWPAMTGIVSGAKTVATEAPELKMEVAKARSRLGNHWAVALMAEGKFPASPKPSPRRAMKKPLMLCTNEWPMAATDQSAMEVA